MKKTNLNADQYYWHLVQKQKRTQNLIDLFALLALGIVFVLALLWNFQSNL